MCMYVYMCVYMYIYIIYIYSGGQERECIYSRCVYMCLWICVFTVDMGIWMCVYVYIGV